MWQAFYMKICGYQNLVPVSIGLFWPLGHHFWLLTLIWRNPENYLDTGGVKSKNNHHYLSSCCVSITLCVSTASSVKWGLFFSCSVVSNSLWPYGLYYTRLPYLHHLPELAQTHVHRVGDAIQPSHPLSSPSLPAFNFSQHQGLFYWVSSLHQVAKVLELQLQHQSFQWIFRTDFL